MFEFNDEFKEGSMVISMTGQADTYLEIIAILKTFDEEST